MVEATCFVHSFGARISHAPLALSNHSNRLHKNRVYRLLRRPSHSPTVVYRTSLNIFASDAITPSNSKPNTPSLARISRNLWAFSRPHTVYGTISSVLSISCLAFIYSPRAQPLAFLLIALIPALLLNIYIVGLNQYYDIHIDNINKPFLPLASGALTKADAKFTIALSLVSGLLFCFSSFATPALRVVLIGSAVIGTLYSAPPIRLKRFPLLASIAILSVRGLLVNLGFFLHGSASTTIPPTVLFASVFFTFFGIVIALLKDVPDIKGDVAFGIRTVSVRIGSQKVFRICVSTLVCMFLVGSLFYFKTARSVVGQVIAIIHVAVAAILWAKSRKVSTSVSEQVYKYYMFTWKTFYLEYLLLPPLLL